jgi:regulator of replication initiation timing
MSEQSKTVALELANQKLMASMEKMKGELTQLQIENKELTERNAYLESIVQSEQEQFGSLKDEHERMTGKSYNGAMHITKFGFSKDR